MRPQPGETIGDPACGTAGFLLGAHQFIIDHNPSLDKDQKKHLKLHALLGVEIVDGVTRLAAMNLLLHGVGPTGKEAEPPVKTDDSLRSDPNDRGASTGVSQQALPVVGRPRYQGILLGR